MTISSSQPPDGNTKAGAPPVGIAGPDVSRRRFIRGGAAGAPVILSLTSRPVFGFENACVAPSRMISGNFSGFTGPTTCGGSARSDWAKAASQSPKPDWAKQDFTAVFGTAYPYASKLSGSVPKKLGPVLLDSFAGNDNNSHAVAGFASFVIAAYLNSFFNVGSVQGVLKTSLAVDMWNDIVKTGEFCPQLAMCWGASGVIGYLQNSGIVPS